ncbi:MAG: glutaredoxin family protein [Bacteroidota bacterium]|nr:glutaredoxin family protein [Bacteroidota bacterium]
MKKVVMYTMSNCPWCIKTKQSFTDWEIPFDCIDYDLSDEQTQEQIIEEMDECNANGFPFVKIGNDVVKGYNPSRYATLLGLKY